jgi:NAD(P)-dependent dehydrogenase (short-subunit alcohol dehydrogenase family)
VPLSASPDFTGKVALVTGAGKGLGRAIALALAQHEARLAVNDITPINLDETLAMIQAQGGEARDYVFDTAKRLPVETMIHEVIEDFGRIDILVTCTQVFPKAPLLDMDEWDWQRVLDVNLGGPFFALQLAGRQMRLQGGGTVVFVASLPEENAQRAAAIASQPALLELARQAALELAPYGVRVNAVFCKEAGAEAQVVAEVLRLCDPACQETRRVVVIR